MRFTLGMCRSAVNGPEAQRKALHPHGHFGRAVIPFHPLAPFMADAGAPGRVIQERADRIGNLRSEVRIHERGGSA